MTFTETRYFRTEKCPTSDEWHCAAVIVTSSQPMTMVSPTITADEVEFWHICPPTGGDDA